MSERRCPNCGGLVGVDAEWCTQCFTRLDQDVAAAPAEEQAPVSGQAPGAPGAPAPAAGPRAPVATGAGPTGQSAGIVRAKGDVIVWDCPECGTENPIEANICPACGTPFGKMLHEPEERPQVDPGRAAMASLFFPGAGHFVAGRRGEGAARGIIFTFSLIMGIAAFGAVRSGSRGANLILMVLSLAAAAVLYVTSTVDAGRAARGVPQILSMRALLYTAVGLIFGAVALLTIAATSARGG
ncbi:MAG: zinc ribbon domain-containing protein [Actinomycetota bacterium]